MTLKKQSTPASKAGSVHELVPSAKKGPASAQTTDGKISGQGKEKDSVSALLFNNDDNFADVFNHAVFCNTAISAADLRTESTRETSVLRTKQGTRTTLTQFRDVIKKLGKDQTLAILAIENQNQESYQMPFRVMEMDYLNYARQIRIIADKHKHEMTEAKKTAVKKTSLSGGEYLDRFYKSDRLNPCITLVIYWGEETWRGPRQLSDMFAESEWTPYAPDYKMHLLEVHKISDSELSTYSDELRMVFGFVKFARQKIRLREFIAENEEIFSNMPETVVDVIADLAHSAELEKIKQKTDVKNERGNYNMCQVIQRLG
ncbi:MAG: Rpn family recombination-promoting nuclease/putative transposase [Clostridiales bacterium]|nr:Rpn family recombination-promoting nuclease/putative transposase [Clostridiales bacterium]